MTIPDDLPTPALLLDEHVMRRNVDRMARRIAALGCVIRPHVKTHKSVEVASIVAQTGHTRGITVSTLTEAEAFFAAGFTDILYAVGLSDRKVPQVAELIRRGCDLTVITDSLAMARRIEDRAAQERIALPVLIELDVDGHRSGIAPAGDDLLPLADMLGGSAWLRLAGVMTHAGDAYNARSATELAFHADREVAETRSAANRLRAAGFAVSIVSIGSTPTASSYHDLTGITEVRAGVYVFFDLVQAGIGIATHDDIALSVLTTVIGHQPSKGWVITDAGWMALSRDRGTSGQAVDYGYGQVCAADGSEIADVIVASANQEHGIVAAREPGGRLDVERFPVGMRLRIKPNHACATAGQFGHYDVLRTPARLDRWPRLHGR